MPTLADLEAVAPPEGMPLSDMFPQRSAPVSLSDMAKYVEAVANQEWPMNMGIRGEIDWHKFRRSTNIEDMRNEPKTIPWHWLGFNARHPADMVMDMAAALRHPFTRYNPQWALPAPEHSDQLSIDAGINNIIR